MYISQSKDPFISLSNCKETKIIDLERGSQLSLGKMHFKVVIYRPSTPSPKSFRREPVFPTIPFKDWEKKIEVPYKQHFFSFGFYKKYKTTASNELATLKRVALLLLVS